MAAVIIRQRDLKRLGKELLNEMFDFLHDEYVLTNFKEMKEVQEKFLEKLAFNHINTLHRQYKITEEKREELAKPFINELFKIDEKVEYDSNLVKDAMKDDGIDTEGIYLSLISLNLDMEINETAYSYLED